MNSREPRQEKCSGRDALMAWILLAAVLAGMHIALSQSTLLTTGTALVSLGDRINPPSLRQPACEACPNPSGAGSGLLSQ